MTTGKDVKASLKARGFRIGGFQDTAASDGGPIIKQTVYGTPESWGALLATPTLTPAEAEALDWAMKLMGNCDAAEALAGLLTRTGAATFTTTTEPGDTVRNTYTGDTGCVVEVDGALTHWYPDGSPFKVTSCTAGLEVIKKAPPTPHTGEEA